MPLTIQSLSTSLAVKGLTTSNPSDISHTQDRINTSVITSLRNGTGAGEANMVWSDQRTIAPGGDDDIDLNGGITDAYGVTITFVNVRGIFVVNRSPNPGTRITVANTGGNFPPTPWAIPCGPGDAFNFMERQVGLTIVPAAVDTLRMTNEDGGASAMYDIVVIGVV